MRNAISYFVALAVIALTVNFVMAADLPQLPAMPEKFKNIQIAGPGPSVPKENQDLLGEWEGIWRFVGSMGATGASAGLRYGQEIRRAKLIIYEVSSDKIKFLFGTAESPYFAGKGGWRQIETDIYQEGGKKRFSFVTAWRIGFYLENGILIGSSGGEFDVEMKRVK